MRIAKLLPALGLGAALLVAGCQNPDGSTDWGSTLLLGAGVGVAAAAIAGAAADDGPSYRNRGGGRYRPAYAQGPSHRYADRYHGPPGPGWGRW